jgi:hypothetical protein
MKSFSFFSSCHVPRKTFNWRLWLEAVHGDSDKVAALVEISQNSFIGVMGASDFGVCTAISHWLTE